jgi:hypothetical protein
MCFVESLIAFRLANCHARRPTDGIGGWIDKSIAAVEKALGEGTEGVNTLSMTLYIAH